MNEQLMIETRDMICNIFRDQFKKIAVVDDEFNGKYKDLLIKLQVNLKQYYRIGIHVYSITYFPSNNTWIIHDHTPEITDLGTCE